MLRSDGGDKKVGFRYGKFKALKSIRKKGVTSELDLIQEQMKSPILTREQILFGITKFRTLDIYTKKGRQTLIDSFVNAIYLYDDYALITCNYKDGTIRISLEEIESSDLLSDGVPSPEGFSFGVFVLPAGEARHSAEGTSMGFQQISAVRRFWLGLPPGGSRGSGVPGQK